ncbi:hypothetical protein NDU88_001348 [Pleurodeles waltl]|uniref:Uncharacterized protein n=1 Tax=Pleurodeles waltl TaxID=8319 RepID=A0AAV7WLW1_PLEWA|nr:hypothetical protein NDU88_001348 [Pleurodeles waltl]
MKVAPTAPSPRPSMTSEAHGHGHWDRLEHELKAIPPLRSGDVQSAFVQEHRKRIHANDEMRHECPAGRVRRGLSGV